jgi:hypothetical protein
LNRRRDEALPHAPTHLRHADVPVDDHAVAFDAAVAFPTRGARRSREADAGGVRRGGSRSCWP